MPRYRLSITLLCILLAQDLLATAPQAQAPAQSHEQRAQPNIGTAPSRVQKPSSNDLAVLNGQVEKLRAAGKYAEALPIAQRALAVAETKYGRDNPMVAAALTNLANLYFSLRRFAEAEPLYKRALAIREKSSGAESPEATASRSDLIVLYQAQGRTTDAEALLKHAPDVSKKPNISEEKHAMPRAERRFVTPAPAPSPPPAAATSPPVNGTPAPRVYREERAPGPAKDQSASEPPAAATSPPLNTAPPVYREEAPAAPNATLAAPEQTDWDVVPVFYGTDRQQEPNPKRISYGSDRGHRLDLGRALVTVPKSHQVPQVERPWSIQIPYFDVTIQLQAEDPKKHFTLQEIRNLSKEDFLRLVHDRLATSSTFKDHALVFVHGYNTKFDNALYRTAQIAYDLHFDGVPFVYSWPSGGGLASYTYDRESAEASEPYLREFLDLVVKQTGAKTISIIAHSMGNRPLLDVLKDMNSATPPGVVISQIILAAPDVDVDNFTILTQKIAGLAKGVTLYAAANDRALSASHAFWGADRAGDVPATGPVVVSGVDSIDITAASTDVFALNHSEYAESNDVLNDLGRLIQSGMRPPDLRFDKLKPVKRGEKEYWLYVPVQTPVDQTGTP